MLEKKVCLYRLSLRVIQLQKGQVFLFFVLFVCLFVCLFFLWVYIIYYNIGLGFNINPYIPTIGYGVFFINFNS
jgi:bacteriorhodopsin